MIALALLTLAPLSASPAMPQDVGAPIDLSGLQAAIDHSIRWLRSQQQEDGGYGSLTETLSVLQVLATSPRKYRASDGPFVERALARVLASQRDDGAFASAGDDDDAVRRQTLRALGVLEALGGNAEAVSRARTFLGAGAPSGRGVGARGERDALLARATALLAERPAAGFWEGEHGRVSATTDHLRELCAIHEAVRQAAPQATVGEARALPAFAAADRERTVAALARGGAFLLAQADAGRWGFAGQPDPGITAMVTGALLSIPAPRGAELDAAITAALDWLVSFQRKDGSIHAGQLANYVTSASVLALARAARPQDAETIARAREFLRILQADEGEGYAAGDRFYGGVGYGGDERPDLSNLQMALEALNAAGVEAGDESFQKALAFLQRCQNRSESNDLALASDGTTIVSGNDGGAGYAPGDSKAGFIELPDGRRVPRSYGSMTYALLKGYLFAGLPRDDPRVEAAWNWLRQNYTLDVNPGFEAASDPTAAYQGLFYYFTTMAKALDLYGENTVVDASGREHAWRAELCGRLVSIQRQDGSWINDNAPRWFEGNPVLATAYAMIALDSALPDG